MKVYAITIKPLSAFGTPLKGDTLFGHFCWQAVHDDALLAGGFNSRIDLYDKRPFAVFSSAFFLIGQKRDNSLLCVPRPFIPAEYPAGTTKKERIKQRKEDKKKKWSLLPAAELKTDISTCEACSDAEVFQRHCDTLTPERRRSLQFLPEEQQKPLIPSTQAHNSINRLTMTTGKGFDPFSMENFYFIPFARLVIFAGIDSDALDADALKTGMKRIGMSGFGRDASTGLGRFSVESLEKVDWPGPTEGAGCYTLAPCVPEKEQWKEQYAMPFTRFGKHGSELVFTGKPFKNPVVMADEGSVFYPEEGTSIDKAYIGTAVTGLSLAEPRTVAQGYSLYLPVSRRNV